ncbi:hypothetical protein LCGC14_2832970 [marine sediment metagenome]|uniref:Uncharacterized protein n=1 Tax=marine sediment metagenome TaxID=412755 RepID=A0A0F9ALZ9_9ZZZZ
MESICHKDLASLLTSSHRSLTFLFKTESEWLISCNTIVQRNKLLREFSLLKYNDDNKKTIRYSFKNNSLWEGMSDIIKDQWVERWRDKARMGEEDWYKK